VKRKRVSGNIAVTCAVVIGLMFFEAMQSASQGADRAFEGPTIKRKELCPRNTDFAQSAFSYPISSGPLFGRPPVDREAVSQTPKLNGPSSETFCYCGIRDSQRDGKIEKIAVETSIRDLARLRKM